MAEKRKAAMTAAPSFTGSTKIEKEKDITKILNYFRYTTGTTLDAMFATGVLRNSITYYVDYLERIGELRAIKKDRDRRTHHLAKYYSADKAQWKPEKHPQLSLFDEKGGEVWE